MRTRAPTRLRQRKGVLKCDACGRKCLTAQALKTHKEIAHKTRSGQATAKKKPVMNKPKSDAKPARVVSIKANVPTPKPAVVKNEPKPVEKVEIKKTVVETDYSSDSSDHNKVESVKPLKKNMRKTEFECPKCKRRFAVYFSAQRHIQKHHRVNGKGEHVPAKSEDVIKPVRIEICTLCYKQLYGNIHECHGPTKLPATFTCLGCNQEYSTLTTFDMHSSGMHSDGVESMFFPSLDELDEWKTLTEKQTLASYTVLDQNDTRQVYRCTFRSTDQRKSKMCPSTIVVQEFAKGFQVHFYKNHFGHKVLKYNLSDKYKSFYISTIMNNVSIQDKKTEKKKDVIISVGDLKEDIITKVLKREKSSDTDIFPQVDDSDLYLQLKNILEKVIQDAAKVKIDGLKELMNKAVEMSAVINSYDEDDEYDDMTLSRTDVASKEVQPRVSTPKVVKIIKRSERLKRKSTEILPTITKKANTPFQSTENTPERPQPKVTNKTELHSPKITATYSLAKADLAEDEIENLINTDCDDAANGKCTKAEVAPSASFNDTFQDFVKSEQKKAKYEKKIIVKTKMGQFKPSPPKKKEKLEPILSPKMAESPNASRNSSAVRVEEYEVKEQENDCNILILKI